MADERLHLRPVNVLVTVTIDPAPLRAADDFKLIAMSATDGYSVDNPVVVTQQPRRGGQALTVLLRIFPSPPPPLRPPPLPSKAPRTHGSECAPVDDPSRPAINILITLTIASSRTPSDDGIKATATCATAGYSVDEPSVRGSYALRGARAVTLCVCTYPSPPPPLPPPLLPWWIVQPDPIAFGRAVREARTRAGVSQQKLAQRTGVSEMTIRNLEYGTSPTQKTRDAVLAALAAAGQPLDPNPKTEES